MAEIGKISAKLELDTKQFTASIGEVRGDLKGIAGDIGTATRGIKALQLGDIGDRVGTLAGQIKSLFGGLAVGTLQAASSFEQLQAKLVSVTGSVSEANQVFEFAKKFAASTPFDVKGIVDASATLAGFKQDVQGMLPVAANLAAALGKTLPEATLVLSKAASGSADGFLSLKDQYAITTKELVKFGAAEGKVAGSLSHAEADIERNRNALVKLIQTRFGDATAKQAATMAGAVSNAGDAAFNLAASLGQTLVPAATAAARGIAGLLDAANKIPAPIKTAIAAGTVFAAGLAAIGTAGAGVVTTMILLQTTIAAFGPSVAKAAASNTILSASLTGLSSAAVAARTALSALALSPVGAALAIAGTLAVAATSSFSSYEKKAIDVGNALAEASRKQASFNKTFRDALGVINSAGKEVGVSVGIVGKSSDQFAQLQKAFSSLSAEQLVASLTDAGETSDSLKEKFKGVASESEVVKNKLRLLGEAQELLTQGKGLSDEFANVRDQLASMGISVGVGTGALEKMEAKVSELRFSLGKLGADKLILERFIAAFADFASPIDEATKSSKELQKYLNLAESVGSANALASALSAVEAQITANAAAAKAGSANLETLLSKLADPKTSDIQKGLIEEQIRLIQERGQIVDQIGKAQQDGIAKEVAAQELAFRRTQALNGENLQQELAFIQQRLDAVAAGTEEEVALLERAAAVKKSIRDKEKQDLEDALQTIVAIGETAVTAVTEAAAEGDKAAADKLAEINASIESSLSSLTTNGEKIVAIEKGIKSLQSSRKSGLIEESAAQEKINALTQQKQQIEASITAEKQGQVNTIAGLELQLLEQQLQGLQLKKSKGEEVDAEIVASQQAIFSARLQQIENERRAVIDAKGDEAFANQQAALKTEALYNQEALRKEQSLAKQTAAVDKNLTQQEARIKQHYDRVGGKNSPLQSFDEAFGGPGSFSLGDGLNLGTLNPRAASPQAVRPGGSRPTQTAAAPSSATTNIYNLSANGTTIQDPEVSRAMTEAINREWRRRRHQEGAG